MTDHAALDLTPDTPVERTELVSVEVVPESKAKFGITTLFAITAILCVQFALINYWGMFGGVMAVFLWFVALGGVAVVYGEWSRYRHSAKGVGFEQKVSKSALPYMVLLTLVSCLVGVGQISYDQVIEWRLKRGLQNDLGYTAHKQVTYLDGKLKYVWFVTSVSAGRPYDQAGIKRGDQIVSELQPTEFLRMMEDNRGQSVDLIVATASIGQPPDKWPKRRVTVAIPSGFGSVPLGEDE